jgi:hypothetical protein
MWIIGLARVRVPWLSPAWHDPAHALIAQTEATECAGHRRRKGRAVYITIFERLKEMGGVEVTSPPDGSGFVITAVSGLKRPKKGR